MNIKTVAISILLLAVSTISMKAQIDLKCEHLVNPLGIDSPQPRFTWRLNPGQGFQHEYKIEVSEDKNFNTVVWNSGMNVSSANLAVYQGQKLKPFTRYWWKVTVYTASGNETISQPAEFETGMMGMHNWQGSWISDHNSREHKPAPYFRKEFKVERKVRSARAYIAVGGLYELYINGERIGNHRLDPMYTRYDRRNLYVTHDVTAQIQNGANAVGVILGNGWYNHQSGAVWDFDNAPWRNRPAFCMDIRIEYENGDIEVVTTDLSWRTSSGPLTFNSIYTSEHYDARLEQEGWNKPGFNAER